MKKLSLICVVLLLSACGGSGSKTQDFPPPAGGGVVTPPAAMVDAFFTLVGQYLSQTGEDTDAASVEAVVLTQPEDTEPQPLS